MSHQDDPPSGGREERRRAPRVEVGGRLTVRVLSSKLRPLRLVNVSAGGLSLTSPEPFMPGEEHRVVLRSGETQSPMLRANVIYWRPVATNRPDAQYLVGFSFVEMGRAQRAAVASFLEQLNKPDAP